MALSVEVQVPDDMSLIVANEAEAHANDVPSEMSKEGAAQVWRKLADMMLAQNSTKRAIEALLEAAALNPDDGETFFILGNLLFKTNQIAASVSAFMEAARCAPGNAGIWNNLGNALSNSGDNGAAETAFNEAVRLEPENRIMVGALAYHLLETGKRREARAAFARLVEINPTDGSAHRSLAGLMDYQPDDPHFAAMQSVLKSHETSIEDRINLGFALFKALDKAGDHACAFSYLEVANRLRRETLDYDFNIERQAFAGMKQFFTGAFFEAVNMHASSDVSPIFIIGMPRSGTTLTEQILSSHSTVTAGGESTALTELVSRYFGRPDGQGLAFSEAQFSADAMSEMSDFYLARLTAGHAPFIRMTDKMPLNFRWIGVAAAIFPNARFVHCRRDAIETCFSIYSNHFVSGGNRYSYDLSELGTYYREYSDLMAYWKTVLLDRIHEVRLDDMVADQETETRLLLAYCGLEFEPQCLDFQQNSNRVRTMSATQVRQPIQGGHAERIKPYLPFLGRLRDELGSLASL